VGAARTPRRHDRDLRRRDRCGATGRVRRHSHDGQKLESQFRDPLRKHSFRLGRRWIGKYEVYKDDYLRAAGDLDTEIRAFVAKLETVDPPPMRTPAPPASPD
jgi:hypothetical protein